MRNDTRSRAVDTPAGASVLSAIPVVASAMTPTPMTGGGYACRLPRLDSPEAFARARAASALERR
jgi:hypothetical protein